VRDNAVRIGTRGGLSFVLTLDAALEVEALHGSGEPIGGWYSPVYHRKLPVTTIVGSMTISGNTTLRHSIVVGPAS
jgi:hypothetical protein